MVRVKSQETARFRASPVLSSYLSGPARRTFQLDSPVNLLPGDFNNDAIEASLFCARLAG
jgi:hypothetical protein